MAAPSKPGSKLSLVIIDDNLGSLEMLSSALSREGIEILTASDPNEGLDLVYAKHPAIVLTDLVMPNLTGMQVRERIGKLVADAECRQRTLALDDEMLAASEFEGIVGTQPADVRPVFEDP